MNARRTSAKLGSFASLSLASFVAIAACIIVDGVGFNVTILEAIEPDNVGEQIGEALQNALSGQYSNDHDVSGTVSYRAKLPYGFQGGLQTVPFDKPCGQSFKERAMEIWPGLGGAGGGGGDIGCSGGDMGGGVQLVITGYQPVYVTASVTTPGGGTSTQQVLVGFQPIYGTEVHDSGEPLLC